MENMQAYEAYLDKVALDISIESGIFSTFIVENRDALDFTEVSKMQIKNALKQAYLRGFRDSRIFERTK